VRLTREQIAWRAAQDLPAGSVVNLGRGLPTLVGDHLPPNRGIVLQSENGLLGVGPQPEVPDPDITDASKRAVSLVPGGSIFDLVESFDMIRGGHIDLVLLGGFQVSAAGDLANWATDDDILPPAVGGAMDLASGCREVWALMSHTDSAGRPKLLQSCTYPLSAAGVVTRIYTDLAVIAVDRFTGFRVIERVPGVDLQSVTGAPLCDADTASMLRPPEPIGTRR
jgi:3-oxoacid CoA-transferase B subunit